MQLTVPADGRFDFNKELLPEDSWDAPDLDDDFFEVDKILDVHEGRATRCAVEVDWKAVDRRKGGTIVSGGGWDEKDWRMGSLEDRLVSRRFRPMTDYQHVRMEYVRGTVNLPVDTNLPIGRPNAAATHVAREYCPHLVDPEWEALQRLATVIGEAAVATMLLESLKLRVNRYVGREGEPLLRWLVEVDTAITARRILGPLSKVEFAMSCLGERPRGWAYRRRLADHTCFSTYEVCKEELRQAFEPPQNEFRSRAEFLDLQQGKHDVHAYAQRARYLVSNIVTNPIDEATKVVTFMKGLNDGHVKTYLFREYPSTLEAAIALVMQEPFSLRHAKLYANFPRPMPRSAVKPAGGPEPMDLSGATAAGSQQRRGSTNVRCFRCGNNGHYARECTAPVHATKGRRDDTGYRHGGSDATETDGSVGAAHAPRGACDPPPAEAARGTAASDLSGRTLTTERGVRGNESLNQKTQIQSDFRGSQNVKSNYVDTRVVQEEPVTEGSDRGASASGADAIGPNANGHSAVRHRGKKARRL
ncbi:unnamed protein product [Phytophthora fragariaefolia]|uniref:Unnamed protein product n=1 Tax=Phytophthora fragariaefolia TaxID=1490495 RepID=A0A9W6X415_9STRA|nr:unnamed protein product [Phytophthora fragariaefolia]